MNLESEIFGPILALVVVLILAFAGVLIAASEAGLINMDQERHQQASYNERCPTGYVLTFNRIQWYCTPGVTPVLPR